MKQILSWCRTLALLCSVFMCTTLAAQKTPKQLEAVRKNVLEDPKVKAVDLSTERQTPSFITLKSGAGYSKQQARTVLEKYLNVRTGTDNLILQKETNFTPQIEVAEFQQYFHGIKVEHGQYKALVKDGEIRFFNGAWFDVPAALATFPKIDKGAALNRAKGQVNAKKYAVEEIEELMAKNIGNAALLSALEKEKAEYGPKGELVIVQDFTKEGVAEMKLAYKFDIYAVEPLSRSLIYVDAADGNILLLDPIIKHANPNPPTSQTTSVQTRYSGTRNIFVKQISGNDPQSNTLLQSSHPLTGSDIGYVPGTLTWALMDDTRGNGIETYDLNGVGGLPLSIGAVYSQGKSFTDVDNIWNLDEHKRGTGDGAGEAESDDIAWDAHWGAEMVYDYWKTNQNRLSFDNKNAKIKSFVHYGIAYDNAFWNGSVMTYGDGSGSVRGFRVLTSLDVCGHEIGHGVCSYTANLVYQKESGAMNEGFSDIWAACTENYVIKNVDPSLATIYRPFFIGEQISYGTQPLRRMDDPKLTRNPDTYGGTNWRNPNCSPTLANDYCGVHTNSGVLNKWFYLITVGSGSGSGPDANYVVATDDGVNDKGSSYSVSGLGFSLSERITYLTELMLSSTATFADARNASISVATTLSGDPCSDMVKTVTNAWYAVGVGAAFVEPCKITYGFINQPGSSVSEGISGAGCTAEYEVKVPVVLPANSTATITTSGTATNGTDYRLTNTSLSNTGTSTLVTDVSVFVKNDGVVEQDETVVLNISITNVGTNTVNSTYTLNIIEDDVTPVIGSGTKTLLSNNFDNEATGFSSPANWTEIVGNEGYGATGENYNQWGVWNGKMMITGKADKNGPVLAPGTYNDASPTTTIIKSPLIDARGLSTLRIKFDFRVQGEIDPNGTDIEKWGKYDYMAVVYSFDGVTFFELTQQDGFGQFASAQPKDGVIEAVLPSYLNNKQFYIGFKWFDDTNAGGPESVQIDNLTLVGSPRKIENDPGHQSSEQLRAAQQVYFYSVEDGQIIANINNTSTKDFGCTNISIARAGSDVFTLYSGTDGDHKVAGKVERITTEFRNNNAATALTLYYTEDQIKALETATGKQRTGFYIYQTNAAYSAAAGNNTTNAVATYTAVEGGGYFSATFSSKLGGSDYTIGVPPAAKKNGPRNEAMMDVTVAEIPEQWKVSAVYPNPVAQAAYVTIRAPQARKLKVEYVSMTGQLIKWQQEQVQPGLNRILLQLNAVTQGTYLLRIRDEAGNLLSTRTFIKQ